MIENKIKLIENEICLCVCKKKAHLMLTQNSIAAQQDQIVCELYFQCYTRRAARGPHCLMSKGSTM